ncbi:MAG: DUF4143 domain-containing protein [Kiritimatiellae bacterium]|nr:DUF4143 domain-containing protein [Kiritimatiellia bacterium]
MAKRSQRLLPGARSWIGRIPQLLGEGRREVRQLGFQRRVLLTRELEIGAFRLEELPNKKRQVKSPKVYIRDTGLLHWHLGIESMAALRAHPRYGASWEGFALDQVLIRLGARNAYYWATQRGAELDLLVLSRGKRWGFEFKCSDAPAMTKSMHTALADLSLDRLWVLHPGRDSYPLHKRVQAMPLVELEQATRRIAGRNAAEP